MSSRVKVILTRPYEDAVEFAKALGSVVDCDVDIWPLRRRVAVDHVVPNIDNFDILIFSAPAGVQYLEADISGRVCWAIGERTAKALGARGANADQVFVNSAALLQALPSHPARYLVVTGKPSSVQWREVALDAKASLETLIVYEAIDDKNAHTPAISPTVEKLIYPVFSTQSVDNLLRMLREMPADCDRVLVPFSAGIARAIAHGVGGFDDRLHIASPPKQPTRAAMLTAIRQQVLL